MIWIGTLFPFFAHGNFEVISVYRSGFCINTPSESKDISISQLEKGSTYFSNHLGTVPRKFNSSPLKKLPLQIGKDRLPTNFFSGSVLNFGGGMVLVPKKGMLFMPWNPIAFHYDSASWRCQPSNLHQSAGATQLYEEISKILEDNGSSTCNRTTKTTQGASDWWKFLMRDFFVPWFSSDFPFVNLVTQMETPLFLSPLTVSMSVNVTWCRPPLAAYALWNMYTYI